MTATVTVGDTNTFVPRHVGGSKVPPPLYTV